MSEYMKVDGKTPAGGDYCIWTYMNDKGEVVDQKEATRCRIEEFKEDGTRLQTTYGYLKTEQED